MVTLFGRCELVSMGLLLILGLGSGHFSVLLMMRPEHIYSTSAYSCSWNSLGFAARQNMRPNTLSSLLCQLVLHMFFARRVSCAQGYYSHHQTTHQPCTIRKCYGQIHCHSSTALFQTSTCWHERNHSSKVLKCCTSETCSPSLCQITFLSKYQRVSSCTLQ